MNDGKMVLFHEAKKNRLIFSSTNPFGERTYNLNKKVSLNMFQGEEVLQVLWQNHPSNIFIGGILTTHRLMMVSQKLELLASIRNGESNVKMLSIFWIGFTLLISTETHILYMTMRGFVHHLVSLERPASVIASVLSDRVILASPNGYATEIYSVPVGLLEPLVMGFIHLNEEHSLPSSLLHSCLKSATKCYDSKRVSVKLVNDLDEAGYSDLALLILIRNPHLLSTDLSFELALRAHAWNTAYDLLVTEQNLAQLSKSPEMSSHRTTELSPKLKEQYQKLAYMALHFGQFEVSRRCYETIKDEPSLLHLYTVFKNAQGIKELMQQTTSEVIKGACSKQIALLETSKTVSSETLERGWPFKGRSRISFEHEHIKSETSCKMKTLPVSTMIGNADIKPIVLGGIESWLSIDSKFYELPDSLLYGKTNQSDDLNSSEEPLSESFSEETLLDPDRAPKGSLTPKAIYLNLDVTNKNSPEIIDKKIGTRTGLFSPRLSLDSNGAPKTRRLYSPRTQTTIPAQLMAFCLLKLEKNEVTASLEFVNDCIQLLNRSTEISPQITKRVQFCVMYKMATILLIEIQNLVKEKNPANLTRVAFLSQILARLPLQPKHKIVCIRLAIKHNLEAENYGVAAAFIDILAKKNMTDKADLEKKLSLCNDKNKQNKDIPLGKEDKICHKVWRIIPPDQVYFVCKICRAMYLENTVACLYCTTGKVVKVTPLVKT
eukprot:TRINITY_DN6635_c0_g1_i1.p1 TRINITY_DN6635_c0_g1~~TRINITY_DN6635_c0_g1_i1.p1  ORF type:complete len:772 (-),score=105.20 TRINITY_DN6635_c0_g1_i1:5-2161(-)